MLVGDGELRITELDLRGKDGLIRRLPEARMKFANQLRRGQRARSMSLQQVFGLLLQVVKVGAGGELSNRHNELPFVCPGPHREGRKSVRKTWIVRAGGLQVLSADRLRPCAQGKATTGCKL